MELLLNDSHSTNVITILGSLMIRENMTTSTRRITPDLEIPILTQEQLIQIIQSNGPEKKRIVAVLAFEFMKTGIDPLHVHEKAVSMLEVTNWSSNSGLSLAANLARCYNEGLQRIPDVRLPGNTQAVNAGSNELRATNDSNRTICLPAT
ncbi:hypothetical protein TWF506_005518 [Arthrobotrys conoides]|uniref:Uncharacterized protein n=1 Tax=Arthrobotrys conoides TaxID=74498 RepID=A0AAN8NC00_9PEZI